MSDLGKADLAVVTLDLRKNGVVVPSRLRNGWRGCLLHGFGASANDLIGLAPELAVAEEWYFPHAPVEITVAGMSYGRAWFPRETDTLQQALFGTYFQSLRTMEPSGLAESARSVRKMLDSRNVDWSRLILGGFSQGAMVVAEILRQSLVDPTLPLPAAALVLSGALIAESWWAGVNGAAGANGAAAVKVFQSHGREDSILPFAEGLALARQLESAGFAVSFAEFDGGHAIPETILHGAARYLETDG